MKWKFWKGKEEAPKKPGNGPGRFGKAEDKPAPEELLRRNLREEMAKVNMRLFYLGSGEPEKENALRERADQLSGQVEEIEGKRGGLSRGEERADTIRWIEAAEEAMKQIKAERPQKEPRQIESDLRFERIQRRHEKIDLDEDALVRFFASGDAYCNRGPFLQLAKFHELLENGPDAKRIEKRIKKKARKLAKKERGKEAAKNFEKDYGITNVMFACQHMPAREVETLLHQDEEYESKYMQDALWRQVMCRGRDEGLYAQGVEGEKSGLLRLVNIILEGRIRFGMYGTLTETLGRTDPVVSEAGSYGPYYVVIGGVCGDMVKPSPERGYIIPEELHSAYLVPRDSEKKMVTEAVFRGVELGIVTEGEAVGALARLITYQEFVDAPYGVFDFVFREKATLSENPSEEERAAREFFSKNAKEMEGRLSRPAGN